MKNKFIKISFVMLAFLLMLSCEEQEDFTNTSSLTATSPSLTVSLGFTNEQTLVEQKADYDFTVTISEVQIVDVLVQLEQTGGTATAGADFTFPSTVTISKGSLSASGTISILADELIEDTETATLQIGTGSEVNVSGVTGETVTFNIANLTEGDLVTNMSWAASETTTDNSGNEIDDYDLADMRLLLTDTPYTNVIDGADGAGAETFILTSATADGEYYLVADFYAAMSSIPTDLDITITFDQVGTINGDSYTFPAALNTAFVCEANYYVLAKVIKTGGTYTIEKLGKSNFVEQQIAWTNGTDVIDAFTPDGYASAIVTKVDCAGTKIKGLNKSWMESIWGEEIVDEGNVYYTTDASGNITIESQYAFTTVYDGSEYIYTVSGNGTLDTSGDTPVLEINYYLDQEGFSPNQWMFDNGYMAQNYFIARVMQ
jgi:hypothetical protein